MLGDVGPEPEARLRSRRVWPAPPSSIKGDLRLRVRGVCWLCWPWREEAAGIALQAGRSGIRVRVPAAETLLFFSLPCSSVEERSSPRSCCEILLGSGLVSLGAQVLQKARPCTASDRSTDAHGRIWRRIRILFAGRRSASASASASAGASGRSRRDREFGQRGPEYDHGGAVDPCSRRHGTESSVSARYG